MININAKEEFLEHISEIGDVKCAFIEYYDADFNDCIIKLMLNYTEKEYIRFLGKLDKILLDDSTSGYAWFANGSISKLKGDDEGIYPASWINYNPNDIPDFLIKKVSK